ncbi:MAG: FkbM family methyltransferase [Sphingobacteriales bacterium]
MKGLINFESIWRRSLKAMGQYYKWLFWQQKNFPTKKMIKMQQLYSQFVNENNLCFDIGANMGSRVATFLLLKAKVIAVEPQQACYKELQKVFKNEEVTIVTKGAGSKAEIKNFYIADDTLISSFSTEWIDGMKQGHFAHNRWDKVEQIEITTLDILITQYGIPDFIKIDTEGFELEVLKGLSTPVKALSFEYTLPHQKDKAIECIVLLNQLYNGNALYNICRDESYEMNFKQWLNYTELKTFLESNSFCKDNFGIYGDIYVKRA